MPAERRVKIDVDILSRVIARGLPMAGLFQHADHAWRTKPGQLQGVSEVISRCGGNVVSVHYSQADTNMRITSCYLHIGMETRDHAQMGNKSSRNWQSGFQNCPDGERMKKSPGSIPGIF